MVNRQPGKDQVVADPELILRKIALQEGNPVFEFSQPLPRGGQHVVRKVKDGHLGQRVSAQDPLRQHAGPRAEIQPADPGRPLEGEQLHHHLILFPVIWDEFDDMIVVIRRVLVEVILDLLQVHHGLAWGSTTAAGTRPEATSSLLSALR